MTDVRFDDIEALTAHAGEFSDWGAPMAVTQEMIDQFAELTGDHQWGEGGQLYLGLLERLGVGPHGLLRRRELPPRCRAPW